MEPMLAADVFRSDLFSTTSLTAAINEIAYIPQRLMELNLFDVQGISTTTAWIEKKGESLQLIPNTARGGPGTSVAIDKRDAIPFKSVHLQQEDRIYADELQNVRAWGSTNQLAGVEQVRDERLTKMSRNLDLTLEYHRLGAIQGLILDADGTTVIEDLYDKFGISAPADVACHLDASWAASDGGVFRQLLTGVKRSVRSDLGGVQATGFLVLCGPAYFDMASNHPEVRETYLNQLRANDLRDNDSLDSFKYGGMVFEDYQASGAVAIDDDEARVIPLGVPGLFQTLFAPADTMEAVNTIGQPKYSLAVPDPSGKNKYLELESQSNPINYCTRPKVLRKLLATA